MNTTFCRLPLILGAVTVIQLLGQGTSLGTISQRSDQVDTTAYAVVQVPPQFPGGKEALFQFIKSTSQYPVTPKVGLLVVLRLLIEKDGTVSTSQVTYANADDNLVKEAKRIGSLLPKWLPGAQDGRVLRAYTSVPIWFVKTNKP